MDLLTSKPPMFENGSDFLSYKAPAGQTFTSYSPSSDINAYIASITGLSGWKLRNLLQSQYGTEILSQAASGANTDSVAYLRTPGFASKASCQTDSDCGSDQVCYTFNDQVLGAQQGPTCSNTVYPEVAIGNEYNQGTPLRQYSNYCSTDDDCKGVDEFTGKNKVGMSCNHYYKGPSIYDNMGLCQVQYESNGRRFYLQQPPGWKMPLEERLNECKSDIDCGPTGVNGWSRCVGGSSDGKKYCVWPGQTTTPSPKDMYNKVPRGTKPARIPTLRSPTKEQQRIIHEQAARANETNITSGGSIGVPGPSVNPATLVRVPEPFALVR